MGTVFVAFLLLFLFFVVVWVGGGGGGGGGERLFALLFLHIIVEQWRTTPE